MIIFIAEVQETEFLHGLLIGGSREVGKFGELAAAQAAAIKHTEAAPLVVEGHNIKEPRVTVYELQDGEFKPGGCYQYDRKAKAWKYETEALLH